MNPTIYSLAECLGIGLQSRQITVTTAESCTGGGVAQAITAVAGSSAWFEGAFVTYSNRLKNQWLGVTNELLDRCGAVSEQVALAMLRGALRESGAGIGVAISGIAGPDGGSDAKPVGTVCFAWGSGAKPAHTTCHFSGDRAAIREQAVAFALEILLEYLDKN